MGNLASVQKALARLGMESRLVSAAAEVEAARRLILPGVGAFGAAMANLREHGLVEPIRDYCRSGRPFLGICLGMQLLMTESDEMGRWKGLDVVPGRVVRFFEGAPAPPSGLKVPHMGWNALHGLRPGGITGSVPEGSSVYFVHSYYVKPEEPAAVSAKCTHGETFCAVAATGNVFATQFHPEKSGAIGQGILRSFCEIPA